MLVMFSAFLLILGSYYHNLPFHNNKEAFLALVGVLEHVSDVHDVHTPIKRQFWIMGLKNIQKIEDLPAGSPVQVNLSAGLDIIFENLGG